VDRRLADLDQQIVGEVGATTTLLVERCMEVGVALQPIEATLLLLGIYEHTGNLSLPTTSPADLVSAAWLLGQGARLQAVGEFLSGSHGSEPEHGDHDAPIRLSLTAADLMSTRVHCVPLEATIAQAAAVQLRYGHTALPVVDSEQVVHGLIARSDLDRALRHGLGDAPVARYMWRGPQLVAPETPVALLRRALLNEHGRITGRLLVVDPQRHIVGIVTRADLLRAWAGAAIRDSDGQAGMAGTLEHFLPADTRRLLDHAAALAERRGTALYLVGGTVRDMLLNRGPGDLDLMVEDDAVGLAQVLASELGGHVYTHAQFGTATLELDLMIGKDGDPAATDAYTPRSLDFVTARTEFYERPAALPEVEVAALRHDLQRRDFTINTLAICLNPSRYGRLYDFFGGRRDLERRLIRVLHNLSFIDDPTRMLRAARLAARLDCTIEPRTQALIADALEYRVLERTSPQRILSELLLALAEPQPERALQQFAELGVLQAIHPALNWSEPMAAWFVAARSLVLPADMRPLLGLALLMVPCSNAERVAFANRYRLSSRLTTMLGDLSTLHARLPDLAANPLANSVIDQLLHGMDELALAAVQFAAPEPAASHIARYLNELRDVRLEVDGHDLRTLGLTPGPAFRILLEGLRAARLDGIAITREQQIAWVRQAADL
jgi:tRNA nucleotidyltransferase (CCA-adding enzyme)